MRDARAQKCTPGGRTEQHCSSAEVCFDRLAMPLRIKAWWTGHRVWEEPFIAERLRLLERSVQISVLLVRLRGADAHHE